MGFLNSYKRLDNLCRDMNGIGVTGYIKDMECFAKGTYFVPGWKEDYFQLKQYRHIRNRIAHENDINENDLCSAEDAAWLLLRWRSDIGSTLFCCFIFIIEGKGIVLC